MVSSEALDPECFGPPCSRPLCLYSMNRPFTFRRTCAISVTIPTPPVERSTLDFFLPIRLIFLFLLFFVSSRFLISKLVDIMYKTPLHSFFSFLYLFSFYDHPCRPCFVEVAKQAMRYSFIFSRLLLLCSFFPLF